MDEIEATEPAASKLCMLVCDKEDKHPTHRETRAEDTVSPLIDMAHDPISETR